MNLLELVMIAVGLSMDAFAVSLCKGLAMRRFNLRHTLTIALFFGFFQAAMPLLGWLLGRQFEQYIIAVDHWIAFFLLTFIGGRMLFGAFYGKGENDGCDDALDLRELLMLAIATSIDALAVGVTLAFLQVSIIPSISLIGIITFLLSGIGVIIGFRFGATLKKKAEATGGAILILNGLKILLEHLAIL